jgi:hypothetical protein
MGFALWSCYELVGKRLLVGITYVDCDGVLMGQQGFIIEPGRCAIVAVRADTVSRRIDFNGSSKLLIVMASGIESVRTSRQPALAKESGV